MYHSLLVGQPWTNCPQLAKDGATDFELDLYIVRLRTQLQHLRGGEYSSYPHLLSIATITLSILSFKVKNCNMEMEKEKGKGVLQEKGKKKVQTKRTMIMEEEDADSKETREEGFYVEEDDSDDDGLASSSDSGGLDVGRQPRVASDDETQPHN
ncbi:hypothetical protein AMTR_s00062p00024140 [Amborella trichopoda]|uniref:Uncharacterized protein n=1 Tax=Amborella trichopoda TaxID=13333 RepID=U5DGF2_AMBTC|nr:hypothetical protein AMTR_s00062p00024140 [Amborella trichopoda]